MSNDCRFCLEALGRLPSRSILALIDARVEHANSHT